MMSSSQASTSSDFELLGSQEVLSQLSCCQNKTKAGDPSQEENLMIWTISSKENPQVEDTPSPNTVDSNIPSSGITGDINSVLVPVMA